jgi:hypothetical protein
VADQLAAKGLSWKGYLEDMGTPCRHPALNGADDTQKAEVGDQYAARHNPFVYFHSIIDSPSCARNDVPLSRLPGDLGQVASTANLSVIVPNLCDDGHDAPCVGKDVAGSRAGGLASVDHFLSDWVPRIRQSAAYRNGGLIIITSDEADTGDGSSCCHERPGPRQRLPGQTGPGGGRVGALFIGKCETPGSRDPRRYNHYALLRSLENLYRIRRGGTDGNGHLGYAAAAALRPFGHDVYDRC